MTILGIKIANIYEKYGSGRMLGSFQALPKQYTQEAKLSFTIHTEGQEAKAPFTHRETNALSTQRETEKGTILTSRERQEVRLGLEDENPDLKNLEPALTANRRKIKSGKKCCGVLSVAKVSEGETSTHLFFIFVADWRHGTQRNSRR